eukprot:12961760-Alexandrium_andersonii.AAC.1
MSQDFKSQGSIRARFTFQDLAGLQGLASSALWPRSRAAPRPRTSRWRRPQRLSLSQGPDTVSPTACASCPRTSCAASCPSTPEALSLAPDFVRAVRRPGLRAL